MQKAKIVFFHALLNWLFMVVVALTWKGVEGWAWAPAAIPGAFFVGWVMAHISKRPK